MEKITRFKIIFLMLKNRLKLLIKFLNIIFVPFKKIDLIKYEIQKCKDDYVFLNLALNLFEGAEELNKIAEKLEKELENN